MSAGDHQRPVVCVFVRNPFRNDARVHRESETIAREGFEVVVFATAVNEADAGETAEGLLRIVRVSQDTPISTMLRVLADVVTRYARFRRRLRRFPRRVRRRLVRAGAFAGYLMRADRSDARREIGLNLQRRLVAVAAVPLRGVARRRAPLPAGTPFEPPPVPPGARRPPPWSVRALRALRRNLARWLGPLNSALQARRYGREAGTAAARLKPVLYHAHDLNVMRAVQRARALHRAPFIYDSHELWPHRNRPDWTPMRRALATRADRTWSRRADRVITVSGSIARHMEEHYGISRVALIRNVTTIGQSVPLLDDRGLTSLERPLMLYVGRVTTNRGLEQLIDALPLIPRGTLVLMGHGPDGYRTTLIQRATALGVAERIHYAGSIPNTQLIDAISRCDIGFALQQNECLSYYYSMPNKMFEYVHARIPIIASDFPEMSRFVLDNGVGITCDSSDPAAIAKAVELMLASPEEMRAYSEQCAVVAPGCTWETERETFVQIYRELIPADRWPLAPPTAAGEAG